jgi:hypothetical protein
MLDINNYIEKDDFSCSICFNEFDSGAHAPICTSCGHTLCKECINLLSVSNSLICPIDKKKIIFTNGNRTAKNQYDNNIILKLKRLIDCSYINIKPLAGISFYFCEDCQNFISSYVKLVHTTAGHKLISIFQYGRKYTEDILKKFLNFDENETGDSLQIINNLNLFVILRYFSDPQIFSISSNFFFQDSIDENEIIYEKNYIFIGQTISDSKFKNDSKIFQLTKLVFKMSMENDIKNNSKIEIDEFTLKKGVYMSNNKEIIYGLFLLDREKNFKRVIGVLKDSVEGTLFFGLINFNLKNQNINSPGSEHTFILKFGLILSGSYFYFGKFNSWEYPNYNLISGEQVNLNTNKIIRKNGEAIKGLLAYEETITRNKFFTCTSESFSSGKPVLDTVLNSSVFYLVEFNYKNKPDDMKQINRKLYACDPDFFDFSGIDFENYYIKYLSNGTELNDEFKIEPIINSLHEFADTYNKEEVNDFSDFKNFHYMTFENTVITFLKPFANGTKMKFLPGRNNFSFILSQNLYKSKDSKFYSGYLFELKEEYKIDDKKLAEIKNINNLFKLKSYFLQDLFKNLEFFINCMVHLLLESPKYFDLYYQDFKLENDERVMENIYYKFDCEAGKVTQYDPITKAEKLENSQKLKTMKIYEFFPDINKPEIKRTVLNKFFTSTVNEAVSSLENKIINPNNNNQPMSQRNLISEEYNNTKKVPQVNQKVKSNTCRCMIF